MKYLFPCLLALPLLTSCVEQEPYHEQNYYTPPSKVEVEPHDLNQHYHQNNQHYNPAAQGRVYHGHSNLNGNKVIVNPHSSQGRVEIQQNVQGHGGTKNTVIRHPHPVGKVVTVPGVVHGHSQQSRQQQEETQDTTHAHN